MKTRNKRLSQAMLFILMFGVVSLFSDMTHEGASSIRGAYLDLLGASAGAIGFISGLGELIGYSMRYVFGRWADKTKQYWPMTVVGYILDVLAVPALALVGEHGWIAACILLVIQRMGKAIKKPAKDTIMSFAASQEGVGKSFGIQEVLDQRLSQTLCKPAVWGRIEPAHRRITIWPERIAPRKKMRVGKRSVSCCR